MVQRCIVLGFWLFFLVACGKEEKAKNYIFQAEVLGQNSDCGEFAVKFTTDIDKVSAVVGYPYSGYYFRSRQTILITHKSAPSDWRTRQFRYSFPEILERVTATESPATASFR